MAQAEAALPVVQLAEAFEERTELAGAQGAGPVMGSSCSASARQPTAAQVVAVARAQ